LPNALLESPLGPHLLLIAGAPASGKSHLAAALVDRFDARCIAKDEIKETLFDALGAGDASWSRALSDASFALQFLFAPRLLAAGGLLVLEGNFRPGEHEPAMRSLLERTGASPAQVLCVASAATRSTRLAMRAADPSRHAGHEDHRQRVQTQNDMTFLDLPGPRLRFDSEASWEGEFAHLLQGLRDW
jgi:predicted kinase